MSTGKSPPDDADLEAFLERQSAVSADYDNLELVEPTAELDARILAAARAVVAPVEPPAPAGTPASATPLAWKPPPRPPELDDDEDEDDAAEDTPPARRPRWLLPAALAASVLAAVGIGFSMLDVSPSVQEGKSGLAAMFAKRARERSAAEKAEADAAARELEVMVMPPPPPPPSFQQEGPQVADLDASIAMIRSELVFINQTPESVDIMPFDAPDARTADSAAEAPAISPASVIQPRNRRLAKIVELYDAGNPELARDALEIFLRDFADDPISRRILAVTPYRRSS